MKGFSLLILGFIALGMGLQAQNTRQRLDSLQRWGRQILEHPEYAKREAANQRFGDSLALFLAQAENWTAERQQVTNMLCLDGPKGDFTLCTWQRPDSNFRYQRYGLLALKHKDEVVVHRLQDQLADLSDLSFGRYGPEQWPGALYYALIPLSGEKDKYTLLGYAPGEEMHTKIIEILEIKSRGRIQFGGKHFYLEQWQGQTFRKPPQRLLLRYSADYSASLRYQSEKKRILMDHLAPPDPKLKSLYQLYGPDFTYDALTWKKGWWYLEEQVKID